MKCKSSGGADCSAHGTATRVKILPRILTGLLLLGSGCSVIERRFGEGCKGHAYVRNDVGQYLSHRFLPGAPARLGIIPFTVSANLARQGGSPGADDILAAKLQAKLLEYQTIPIVEILDRDWPEKGGEFFRGNHGALLRARDAGYDLLFVGYLQPLSGTESMTASGKLLDVESGVTIWFGQIRAFTRRRDFTRAAAWGGFAKVTPSELYFEPLFEELAQCMAREMMKDEV
jgi:hypothetical protein